MSHFTVWVDIPGDALDAEYYIEEMMEPFCEQTEDPDYLEFHNVETEYRAKYEEEKHIFIRMPNGQICTQYHPMFYKRYALVDGKVVRNDYGQLHHRKRNKKAKQMQVLPDYPFKKAYRSFDVFMKEYSGYDFVEEEGAYGYYVNPNAFYDWFRIGGRWSFVFLVKQDCPSAIGDERSWRREDAVQQAPQGYVWVAGARKADIAWDVMKQEQTAEAIQEFSIVEQWFASGEVSENVPFARITENGIAGWGEMLYIKGETLEQYLERHNLGPDCKYPCSPYGFLQDNAYCSKGDMGWWAISTNEKDEDTWRSMVQEYLESVPDDHMIVSLDCHI